MEHELRNVAIEPTDECNLNCKMCFARGKSRELGRMGLDNFLMIVNELKTIQTVRAVSLNFGGEPLVHPDFASMMRLISHSGWRTGFATNAMLLTPQIAAEIVHNQITQVDIGLDATGPKVEELRRGTKYDVVKRNVRTLVSIRDATGSQYPVVGINCAMTNDHTLADILMLIEEMYDIVDMIRILPARNEDLSLQHEELFDYVGKGSGEQNEFCSSPDNYMGIMWNGDVVPCCWDLSSKTVMGNVLTDGGVQAVFDNDKYEALRTASHEKFAQQCEFQRCAGCKVWQKPRGISMGKKIC
jgi:radical SAM protein with 4Fe4S-binding SPASM domain